MFVDSRDNIRELRQKLIENLTLDFFEDDEIADILQVIRSFDRGLRQQIFALCVHLSGASSSFVPNTLMRIRTAAEHLPVQYLEQWLTHAFDLLDAGGPSAFLKFTSQTDEESLDDFRNPDGLPLGRVIALLEAYVRGIAGMDLKIKSAKYAYTDTSSIFLPPRMNRFMDNKKNFFLYKLSAVHKWCQIIQGTLTPGQDIVQMVSGNRQEGCVDIDMMFSSFSNRHMAQDIYNILEAIRHDFFLKAELPGLMKDAEVLRRDLFDNRVPLTSLSQKTAAVECLYQYSLAGTVKGKIPPVIESVIMKIPALAHAEGPDVSASLLCELYPEINAMDGCYQPQDMTVWIGRLEPARIAAHLREKRRIMRDRINSVISRIMDIPDYEPPVSPVRDAAKSARGADPLKDYLLIRGRLIELDDDIREAIDKRGGIPGGILIKGSDAGGCCPIRLSDLIDEEEDQTAKSQRGGLRYDEWDYRRGGYKRSWCYLYEHDVRPGNEPFVELTLQRYGGYVSLLRKQFELMKREPSLLKRQKEGQHIDLDATVESFADMRAGLSPSENVFMRYDRRERNIAVLFLLDMSGSTKGWVSQAEKEALVLMSEALEALGDRYAIYGFSGLTRSRCDYYRGKGFAEDYVDAVKRRIAGVTPKEYTRMGPPLRHSIQLLGEIEARTKLLITLSDGRPEDWGAYKGNYGMEDTRRALIEAKEQGIHPFCIIIDSSEDTCLPFYLRGVTVYLYR